MNIFVLSLNPEEAAKAHCDKHVVKMILETAQLLSTAHHVHPSAYYPTIQDLIYKKTHVNHPCAIWVRANKQNYLWAFSLLFNLLNEYTFRYGKVHKTQRLLGPLALIPNIDQESALTPFAQAMPEVYRSQYDAVEAYRSYYINEKSKLLTYTKREKPEWLS